MNLHVSSYLIFNSENYTYFTDEQIDGGGNHLAQSLQIPFSFSSLSLVLPHGILYFYLFIYFLTIVFSCILPPFYNHVLVCFPYMMLQSASEAPDLN